MPKKLILNGVVQGVFCRSFCIKYAREMGLRGSATNLRDGTVRVLLATDDDSVTAEYAGRLKNNPGGFTFYGTIQSIDVYDYSGPISGDYVF